jgi:hypothetical protein
MAEARTVRDREQRLFATVSMVLRAASLGRRPETWRDGRGCPGRDIQPREGMAMNADWRVPAGLHTARVRLPFAGGLSSFGGATAWQS